ncbi:hypothetical protein BP6252_06545 [Coleophoma cylindrospora]|uniref:Putative gamma-glutamylcyclotransferase n=1 Tax=Coleophoma cylindrospora TaxID=1849047 RepID=A0A3D8RMY4_9HELO|nr:hypothetical protein BP6252_06545 [Coleophoma cylindrospora]
MDDSNHQNGSSPSSTSQNIIDGNKRPAKRNIMTEKFRAYQSSAVQDRQLDPYRYVPKPCFFYGSLTDPAKLQEVLQLPSTPVLRPARVKSYKIMLWGQSPTLVDGPRDSYVDGMAYVVETEQHLEMLKNYEIKVYCLKGIRIELDGEKVSGRVFAWADRDLGELTEGTWSLEEWKQGIEEMASHFRPTEN